MRKSVKPTIITVASQKGGVGKTTLAASLGAVYAGKGYSVLLIDADPQGSLLDFAAARDESAPRLEAVALPKPVLHTTAPKIAEGFDIVLIDAPPRMGDVTRSALAAADIALIPVTPSALDLWASKETALIVQELQIVKPSLFGAFVLNRSITGSVLSREALSALQELELPVMRSGLGMRVAFAESLAVGKSVTETRADPKAAAELQALAYEVLEYALQNYRSKEIKKA